MTPRRRTLLLGALVAGVLFLGMALIVAGTGPWQAANAPGADGRPAANDLDAVVGALFGPHVIAFEVLGILLTAAMIGALVIARPLEAPSDESRYAHPTPEQVAETDRVSDVRHAPGLEGAE